MHPDLELVIRAHRDISADMDGALWQLLGLCLAGYHTAGTALLERGISSFHVAGMGSAQMMSSIARPRASRWGLVRDRSRAR
jgi:hypothetical protein